MTYLLLTVAWLLGVALFANGIGERTFTWFRLLTILLWPISLVVFMGWIIALHFGWTTINW